MSERYDDIVKRLTAPFSGEHVRYKPGVVSGNRALVLWYVDARAVQDRLDEVLGVTGWQDHYDFLPCGAVVCSLRLRFGEEWITKMDVGGQSEQPDEGDRTKAAVSDALKRAAVKFGVGRYLYSLPAQWADFDPQKRRFVKPPESPGGAPPAKAATKSTASEQLKNSLLAQLRAACAKGNRNAISDVEDQMRGAVARTLSDLHREEVEKAIAWSKDNCDQVAERKAIAAPVGG